MTRVRIVGTGSYLPERIVTNEELAQRLTKTSDEWIYTHTGIKARHVAAPDESASAMGLIAAQRARQHGDSRLRADAVGFLHSSGRTWRDERFRFRHERRVLRIHL